MYILNDMQSRVAKWGNSLAVRLPKEVVRLAGIKLSQSVTVRARGRGVFIELVKEKDLSLTTLLSKVNKKNRHDLVNFGAPVGKEIW